MAANPESPHKMATSPEPLQKMATMPQSPAAMDVMPQSSAITDATTVFPVIMHVEFENTQAFQRHSVLISSLADPLLISARAATVPSASTLVVTETVTLSSVLPSTTPPNLLVFTPAPPEVAASAAEAVTLPSELFDLFICPVLVKEAVSELFACSVTAKEAIYELSACPVTVKGTVC
ncbi:CCR4-NOT transcriptional complex subunit CAF120 [Labeo rohita]|uniref:CCR4-NOT transcriptional complex subunit CAF120 n=1 Tax=Labeo rohita TaxID=84645 RepID=A0ABQ8MKJ7_LABRO|nr:CCR4-NOT transcriptional complex subunit CAF120 [Labeo rohita]